MNSKDTRNFIKIFNLFVLICAIIGLFFSTIGLFKFTNQRHLFIIGILGSALAILITTYDLFLKAKNKKGRLKQIFAIISGIFSVWVCLFVIFWKESSSFLKSVAIFGVIFFSLAIIKGSLKLFKDSRDSKDAP